MAKKKKAPKNEHPPFSQREDFPFIEFTVRAYNTKASEATGGKGLMTFVLDSSDVSDEETNEHLGYVGGGLGSFIVSSKDGYFMIPHDQVWTALHEALEKQKEQPNGTRQNPIP